MKLTANRYLLIVLVLALVLSLAACRDASDGPHKNPPATDPVIEHPGTDERPPLVYPGDTDTPADTDPVDTLPFDTTPAGPDETTPPPVEIPTLTSKSGTYHDYGNGIIRVDNHAFEEYGYVDSAAAYYAGLVNSVAEALYGDTQVYCMALPTAIGIVLPDDIAAIFPRFEDQGEAIHKLYAKITDAVTTVNCYDNLMPHRDEYLYFRTDFHWNGPAAYYAYEAFCREKGIRPYTLEERTEVQFDGFLGALYNNSCDQDPILAEEPDVVLAYRPYSAAATMKYTDWSGNVRDWNIIYDVSTWAPSSRYSTFAGGDSPFAEFTNPQVTDGSVCIVVKESYGNALLPYLVDHYSKIYEIDYRYWDGNLVEFAREQGADDLIFANNMSMIRSQYLIAMLDEIIG
ncbi:MAG: hypothetical protein E7627_07695 [Ruminococcaceae bacterium]|nr:hypothetical protein [Oscillospiraceae bacterium]